ncbi:hypothetical protein I553_10157 [Mycobacterium xenopi 4042]|uniref:Uncharacterized protein n=1 Tax=Mycobacterium xenopi 4042 TaxID=1299334 RepID=X7ZP88_MYCXE|nr:hypothetical protein I553_10157 [Mycobacterium xenopi 4042]
MPPRRRRRPADRRTCRTTVPGSTPRRSRGLPHNYMTAHFVFGDLAGADAASALPDIAAPQRLPEEQLRNVHELIYRRCATRRTAPAAGRIARAGMRWASRSKTAMPTCALTPARACSLARATAPRLDHAATHRETPPIYEICVQLRQSVSTRITRLAYRDDFGRLGQSPPDSG